MALTPVGSVVVVQAAFPGVQVAEPPAPRATVANTVPLAVNVTVPDGVAVEPVGSVYPIAAVRSGCPEYTINGELLTVTVVELMVIATETVEDVLLVQSELPAYIAVTASVPAGRFCVVRVATPLDRVTVPSVEAPFMNVTVPVGVVELEDTVAVNVM
jgi:hypothetical protein